MNSGKKKRNSKNFKLFKSKCNNCGKYVYRAPECWVNSNKNDNRNDSKTASKICFNRELNNCGKRGHRAVDFWVKKVKEKYNSVDNLFVRATFCGEV